MKKLLCMILTIVVIGSCGCSNSSVTDTESAVSTSEPETEKQVETTEPAIETTAVTTTKAEPDVDEIEVSIPITVQIIDKVNWSETTAGVTVYFNNRTYTITNNGDKDIAGILGEEVFKDMFGRTVFTCERDFTDGFTANSSKDVVYEDVGMYGYNDYDNLYEWEIEKGEYEFHVKMIVYSDKTKEIFE